MKNNNIKGVTLIALVITIVILIILASVGVTSGMSTIKSVKYTTFVTELKIMQSKVNELYQNKDENLEKGQALLGKHLQVLNNDIISEIIYSNKTQEEKQKIQNGFRFFSQDYIKNELGIESVSRDYLINVEKRIVISYIPFNYKDTNYYMLDQTNESVYRVDYNNKNSQIGDFDVTAIREGNQWKIQIANIQYEGYISNWQVKYKLEEDLYWNTSNTLDFYVSKEGTYIVKVIFADEIDLGEKTVLIQ